MKNLKNQNFEKMNKIAGDIITLHMCTKNLHHMRHSSWETEWDRLEALKHENNILWEVSTRYIKKSHMCEKPEKSEFWKNEQNCWIYHHFTHVTKNLHHMRHSPEIQSETELSVILDHFWPFYSPLPPNNLENQNFEKWKKHLEMS